MHSVARRQPLVGEDEILGREHVCLLDPEYIVDDRAQGVERMLDPIAAIGGDVAMHDLLEHLAARDQVAPLTGEPLERALSVDLVGMLAPNEIHRDVCVDEDHVSSAPGIPASISARRLASVSASIVSISTSRSWKL